MRGSVDDAFAQLSQAAGDDVHCDEEEHCHSHAVVRNDEQPPTQRGLVDGRNMASGSCDNGHTCVPEKGYHVDVDTVDNTIKDETHNTRPKYAQKEFWDKRFLKNPGAFDWYATWTELAPFFAEHAPAPKRVLMVGCGNSTLSRDMHKAGYDVTNIDVSGVVIERMAREHPEMQWLQMDATAMTFANNSFDIVVDKGTIDALACYKGGTEENEREDETDKVPEHVSRLNALALDDSESALKSACSGEHASAQQCGSSRDAGSALTAENTSAIKNSTAVTTESTVVIESRTAVRTESTATVENWAAQGNEAALDTETTESNPVSLDTESAQRSVLPEGNDLVKALVAESIRVLVPDGKMCIISHSRGRDKLCYDAVGPDKCETELATRAPLSADAVMINLLRNVCGPKSTIKDIIKDPELLKAVLTEFRDYKRDQVLGKLILEYRAKKQDGRSSARLDASFKNLDNNEPVASRRQLFCLAYFVKIRKD